MPNEREAIAALFRRALQPRPDPADVERDAVERLVARAVQRCERRELRRAIRAVFKRLILQLRHQGWPTARDGECAECANDRRHHPFWSKPRPQYGTCPRGHRVTAVVATAVAVRLPRCGRLCRNICCFLCTRRAGAGRPSLDARAELDADSGDRTILVYWAFNGVTQSVLLAYTGTSSRRCCRHVRNVRWRAVTPP
jgi:hypothetical protein